MCAGEKVEDEEEEERGGKPPPREGEDGGKRRAEGEREQTARHGRRPDTKKDLRDDKDVVAGPPDLHWNAAFS